MADPIGPKIRAALAEVPPEEVPVLSMSQDVALALDKEREYFPGLAMHVHADGKPGEWVVSAVPRDPV